MIKHKHLALALSIAFATPGSGWGDQPRILNKVAGLPEVQAEHWYSIRALGEEDARSIEVFIYGEIGFWGLTSGDFIRDLQAQDDGVSPVLVHFDTIGGDLFDGIAIHNTLRALGERCTARIDGACFSAGSVAACGAHRVEMADNALMMIHNPWTWMAGGSEELRKMADMMDKAREGIIASYQHRALTIDDAELGRLIDEETWLTPAEALAHGFVDAVLGAGEPLARNAAVGKILNRYRNAPPEAQRFVAQADEPPAPEPEDDPAPEPAPDPEPVDTAQLAEQLARDCAAAGLANSVSALIRASGLKSAAAVQAALERAKEVKAVCVAARLPKEADALIEKGLDAAGARAALFDKLVANSDQVHIDNRNPVDDGPQNTAYTPPTPGNVYAARRKQASKGGSNA